MSLSKGVLISMFVVSLSMLVITSFNAFNIDNGITGLSPGIIATPPIKVLCPPNNPDCEVNPPNGFHTECSNEVCVVIEGFGGNQCSSNADCAGVEGGGDGGSNNGGGDRENPTSCTDGTPLDECSAEEYGLYCDSNGNLIEDCLLCGCGPGYACNIAAGVCEDAVTCEDSNGLCLNVENCPQDTTSLPQFDLFCNANSVPIGRLPAPPKICCWPNQDWWESNGADIGNGTITAEVYSDIREQLGICIDNTPRNTCAPDGLYCNGDLNLVQDCTKCGCGPGLLCYQTRCVDPEQYERLAFFDEILQFTPIEKILVLEPQEKVHDVSLIVSPQEYLPSFSPLYSGAQDVVPRLSPSMSPTGGVVLSGEIEDTGDSFDLTVDVINGRPSLRINLNA